MRQEVRVEAYGEDIGQNSWLTADEWRHFLQWLELSPGSALLEVEAGPEVLPSSPPECRAST